MVGGVAVGRRFLESGYNLILGGISYRIEGVEGCGNNSVVYRASYEDGLNAGSWHKVLIKELFPYHPKDLIWRGEHGEILHADECGSIWLAQQESFYRGNQVNLELLGENPDGISGNLNSFEAYGTYYSVLTLHGGCTLADMQAHAHGGFSLEQICHLMEKILVALDGFHRNGYLHLDISPDNILVTGDRVLLIDYNSVWPLKSGENALFYSVKSGYTAPEVRLRDKNEIGTAADIYSVCAVYFRMLTGRRPEPADTFGRGVLRALPKTLPVFDGVSGSAVYQTVKIAARGLCGLPGQRYLSAAQLLEEIRELSYRLEGRGVTLCALWEGSRRAALAETQGRTEAFARSILRCTDGSALDDDGLEHLLVSGQNLFLTGSGGMGKTTLLRRLWRENTRVYRPDRPVMIYISLAGYQETGGEAGYIKQRLLASVAFGGETSGQAEIALEKLLDGALMPGTLTSESLTHGALTPGALTPGTATPGALTPETATPGLILLLDGLNEAGSHRTRLLKEIAALGRKSGVSVLVTSRTEDIRPYGFESFDRLRLLPLAAKTVTAYLEAEKIDLPEDDSFLNLLENPMVLSLYVRTVKMSWESGADTPVGVSSGGNAVGGEHITQRAEAGNVSSGGSAVGGEHITQRAEAGNVSLAPSSATQSWTMDRIVERFLEERKLREMAVDSGDDVQQLRVAYIIDHLLPEIAGEMVRRKRTLLSAQEMAALMERDYRRIKDKAFGRAFPEYLGKSRKLFEGIHDAGEWYDYAVCELLVERMDLLVKTKSGSFCLLHDNFSGCLCLKNRQNKKRLSRHLRKKRLAAGAVIFAAMLVITAVAVPMIRRPFPSTQAELSAVKNAMNCLAWNMQLLDNQLSTQQMILTNAEDAAVLDGDGQACVALAALAQRKIDAAALEAKNGGGGAAWIGELSTARNTIPLDVLQNVYARPERMQPFFSDAAGYLISSLCGDGISLPRERKRAMIDAYNRYLKAYTTVAYLDFMQVLAAVPKGERDEVLEAMAGTGIFSAYMADNDFGAMTAEDYAQRQKAAQEVLDVAENEMLIQGYPVSVWP